MSQSFTSVDRLQRFAMRLIEPRTLGIMALGFFVALDASWWILQRRPAAHAQASGVSSQATLSATLTSLFGTDSAPPVSPSESVEIGAIQLNGTLAFGGAEGHGFAILTIGGTPRLVAVNATVGNGRLVAVYADRVLIEQDGQMRTLKLPRAQSGAGGSSGDDGAPVASGPALRDPPVEEVKARVARALTPLASVLRAEPLLSDDAYRGLVVNPNGNTFAFKHMGLQPGDSIMAVNGIPLTQDNLNLFADEMRTGRPVKVSLMRPGVGMVEVTLNTSGIYVGP
jgi:type II secretion system protein C